MDVTVPEPAAAAAMPLELPTGPLVLPRRYLPGLLLAVVLAVAATAVSLRVPIAGAPVIAIVLGILVRQRMGAPAALRPGIRFSSKQVLQLAIVTLGAGLSMRQVWVTGSSSLLVLLGTLVIGLPAILLFGRLLGIDRTQARLIGVGTAICGASAIGAMAPILEAEETAVAYAISTIFLYNVTAVLLFPPIGHLLGLSQHGFGVWAGTAVNDMSSVVAASYSFGAAAGAAAVVVKLTRTLLIVPLSLLFAALVVRERRAAGNDSTTGTHRVRPPLFIGFFVLASIANGVGLLNWLSPDFTRNAGQFLITVALAGVGLSADLRGMARTGYRPLLLGLFGWITLAVTSLALQWLAGTI